MKCQECGHPAKNFRALATHIQFKHNKKDYYDNYMKEKGEGFCKICNKETKFTILNRGYEKFCSNKCEKIDYSKRMSNNNPMKTKKAKQNQRNTNIERYGVSQNTKRLVIKEQIKQTNLKKYGVENVSQDKNIKNKAKIKREETCMREHGVKSYLAVEKVKEKIKQTNLKRYGVEYSLQSKKVRDKIKQTNLKRYGVENVIQNSKIFEKAQKSAGCAKLFKDIYYRGSYELDFLEKFYEKIKIEQGLSFKYQLNEQEKIYHSDFYLPELNMIVEIKNSYLANKDKEIIKKKRQAALKSKYDYIMIIDKDYLEFENLFKAY